jgi:hypothetical protein
MPPLLPAQLDVFSAEVIPILQRRTKYEGSMLRDHYGLPLPQSVFDDPAWTGRFETASPRFRHGTHAAASTWLSWGRPEASAEPSARRDPNLPFVTTAANGRDGEGFRSFADIGADGEVAPKAVAGEAKIDQAVVR